HLFAAICFESLRLGNAAADFDAFNENIYIGFAFEIVRLNQGRRKRVSGAEFNITATFRVLEYSSNGIPMPFRIIKSVTHVKSWREDDFQVGTIQRRLTFDKRACLGNI